MPDTIVRPGNHNGDAYAARNKLGVAIAALAEERERHDHLVAAQDRAHHDLQAVHGSLLNAQDALTKARRAKPQELAYAYASGSETLQLRHSVAEADALVKRRKDELEHLQEIDRALTAEIEQVEVRLRNCQSAVHEALSRVVAASTEFGSFCDELDKTWLRLRSLKVAADNNVTQRYVTLHPASRFSRTARYRFGNVGFSFRCIFGEPQVVKS